MRSLRRCSTKPAGIAVLSVAAVAIAVGAIPPRAAVRPPATIAFSGGTANAVPYQVFVARRDGSVAQLTRDAGRRAVPPPLSWSPDGSRLLALDDDGVHVIRGDGSSDVRVSRVASTYEWVHWSPDGHAIALHDGSSIVLVRADGRGRRVLTTHASTDPNETLSWSPDGAEIAYSLDGGVHVVNTRGAPNPRRIHAGTQPLWSPDGSRIAFQWGLWVSVMNRDGTGARRLQKGGGVAGWSPQGRALAFWTGIIQVQRMFTVQSDGTRLRQVCDHCWLEWFPDGRRVAVLGGHGHPGHLSVVDAAGSHRRLVARTNSGHAGFSVAPDGTAIAYVGGPDRKAYNHDLYVVRPDGSGRRVVASSATIRYWYPVWQPRPGS